MKKRKEKLTPGETWISASVAEVFPLHAVLSVLWRHLNCDWGDLSTEQRNANDNALAAGEAVTSVYALPGLDALQIVTEINRGFLTTVSLAVERRPFELISLDAWVLTSQCPTCGQ